jgi:hypothetical protein
MKIRLAILIFAALVLHYQTADCPCKKDTSIDWGLLLVIVVFEEILREVLG